MSDEVKAMSMSQDHHNPASSSQATKITNNADVYLRMRLTPNQLALKQADYDSMMESLSSTERYLTEAGKMHNPQAPAEDQLSKDQVISLNDATTTIRVAHNLLINLYGPPSVPPSKSLLSGLSDSFSPTRARIAKGALEDYNTAIRKLFGLLMVRMNLPPMFHHLQLPMTNCILQTLKYCRKYHLMPAELDVTIESKLTSPAGLQWIAEQTQNAFVEGDTYGGAHHSPLSEIEFLQYHPAFSQFADLYNRLDQNEKHLVLFYALQISIQKSYSRSFPQDGKRPKTPPVQVSLHETFMVKLEPMLLKQFEHEDSNPGTAEGFRQLHEEILDIKNYLIQPDMQPQLTMKQVHQLKTNSFLALKFLETKLGTNFMAQLGLQEHDTEEFKMVFKFMKVTRQMDVWKNLVYEYENHFDITSRYHRLPSDLLHTDSSMEEAQKTVEFYQKKLMGSVEDYSRLVEEMARDSTGQLLLQHNQYISAAKNEWDKQAQGIDDIWD
ncbi:hypothetical protein PCASD_23318 [Puccinia coronata f. sp. avenae]|uniref:Uncharacterized protein n=1 Tax=Puccinia coronata f. sp. avenae TaxID=200324 RepID=A0A2N5TKT8_9BASI|nr:hypothetical protein PCASD_23318 [Puccinia coronata f. sp. avenae]